MVKVRIIYPLGSWYAREKALLVADALRAPGVEVEVEGSPDTDEIYIIGPNWVTADLTRASALLQRHILANGGGSGG